MNDIIEKVSKISKDIIDTAVDLIKIPTRNPPGEEYKSIGYIKSRLEENGMNVKIINEPYTHRPQIIAWNEEPKIILNGHIDTVPEGDLELWSVDPFGGIIKDNILYGRGSVDMKSALALMINMPKIIQQGLLLTFAIGEERAEDGTRELLKYIPKGIRYGIVLEPTSLDITPYQRGAIWAKMIVRGKAAHASLEGLNAIHLAINTLNKIKEYADTLKQREELNLAPTCNITMINAGIKENIIPDKCIITIDRRLLPSEKYEEVLNELYSINNEIEILGFRDSVKINPSSLICNIIKESMIAVTNKATIRCFEASTDNEHLVKHGIESIVWGPGNISYAHSIDEHININEIINASKVLALSLYRLIYESNL